MRSLILLALFAIPASAPAAPSRDQDQSTAGKPCVKTDMHWTKKASSRAEARPLGELPPGSLTLAVVREVEGCIEPVVVRYGYGGAVRDDTPTQADREERPAGR